MKELVRKSITETQVRNLSRRQLLAGVFELYTKLDPTKSVTVSILLPYNETRMLHFLNMLSHVILISILDMRPE